MNATSSLRLVSVSALRDPTRLEALVRRVFGEGDRAPGWFELKRARECVDDDLSRVAIAGDDPDDEDAWRGYVLVGTPPSLGRTARTSGAGVVPSARRQGIGGRLFDVAQELLRTAGYERLRVPARDGLEPWFRSRGYRPVRGLVTLLAWGAARASDIDDRAPILQFGRARNWNPTDDDDRASSVIEVSAWLPEAWNRTPLTRRCTFETAEGLHFDLAREGRSILAHRILATGPSASWPAAALADAIDRLRGHFDPSTPLLVSCLDPVSSVTDALKQRGWVIVQRGSLMQRVLDPREN